MKEMKTVVVDIREGKPSASGFARLRACPGSWQAESGLPEQTSKDAEAGTRLHLHMEKGTKPEDPEAEEMLDWCRETEAGLVKALGLAGAQPMREMRLWAKDAEGNKIYSGAADVVYTTSKGEVLVIDYKFGRVGVGSPAENLQLAALALLVADNAAAAVSVIYTCILQPYVSRAKPAVARYLPADLVRTRAALGKILLETQAEGAMLRPSEAACKYCKAFSACPAAARSVEIAVSTNLVTSWAGLSSSRKAEIYQLSKLASKYAEKVKDLIKSDFKQGLSVDGLTLNSGKTQFEITNPSVAYDVLNGLIGLSAGDFAGCCKVRIGDLDTLVLNKRRSQMTGKLTVAANKEWLRETIKDCASITTTAGSIVEVK